VPAPECGGDCWMALGLFAGSYEVYVNGWRIGVPRISIPPMRITGSHVLSGFLAPFSRIDQSQSPCARETGNSSGGGQDKAS
jgi:hypothetical protein